MPNRAGPSSSRSSSGSSRTDRQTTWVLVGGILPDGRTSPPPGSTWGASYPSLTACVNESKGRGATAWTHCLVVNHLHYVIRYQPESHYWALQGLEAGLFVAASLVLLAAVVLVVRRIAA